MTLWGQVTALERHMGTDREAVELKVDFEPLPPDSPNLSEGIRALYQKCQFFDVVLVAGGKRFPAHQAALAAMGSSFCSRLRQAIETPEGMISECGASATTDQGSAGSVAAASPTAEGQAVEPAPTTVHSPTTRRYPELHLDDISSPEAVFALLNYVYGLGHNYEVNSHQANCDVLRLAQRFELPSLEELASKWLLEDVNTSNVVDRLATCAEFKLTALYEEVVGVLLTNGPALQAVAKGEEVMAHPKILQDLLARAAALYKPDPSRKRTRPPIIFGTVAPEEGEADKRAKAAGA